VTSHENDNKAHRQKRNLKSERKQIVIKKSDAKKERSKGEYEGKEETKGRISKKKTKAAAG
jgi:hypothetical protein